MKKIITLGIVATLALSACGNSGGMSKHDRALQIEAKAQKCFESDKVAQEEAASGVGYSATYNRCVEEHNAALKKYGITAEDYFPTVSTK